MAAARDADGAAADGAPAGSRRPVVGRRGMVCTSQPLASQVGLDVLRDGGTAVDAAIAANAVLGLTEPTGCGVGGDLFALVWDAATATLHGLNGSGPSPRRLTLDELTRAVARAGAGADAIPERGALSVSVPGAVDGWCALHERFGRLPLARLLAPGIELARDGFAVTPVIARAWRRAETAYAGRADFAATFLPGGRAPRAGETFVNPDLARTYERIAADGADALRRGEIARAVAACVRAEGGWLDEDDLAHHRSEWVDPVSVRYRGHDVWELPPNGQGLAALQMLAMLDGFDLRTAGLLSADALHLMIEAKKLAFEDRARLYADPRFARAPIDALLSDAYAAERRALIDPARAAQAPRPGDLVCTPGAAAGGARWPAAAGRRLAVGDTVTLVTADADGNVASWIQSNYMGFGSGLVPAGTGFGLQNRGCLFALDPHHANVFAPGKRPFHTIIPALVTHRGAPVFAFGVMGGDMQPQGHVQVVSHLLDHGLDAQAAGDAPRWRHLGGARPTGGAAAGESGRVFLEPGIGDDVAAELARRGHRIVRGDEDVGGYQGVVIEHALDARRRTYRGGTESRKDGIAVGW